jgi:hypothetical protein
METQIDIGKRVCETDDKDRTKNNSSPLNHFIEHLMYVN